MTTESPNAIGLRRPGSPYSEAECEEIIKQLEELLDGELDASREKQFIEMVNSCDYCLEQYKFEKSFRRLLKNGLSNLMMSNSLVRSIRNKIRTTDSDTAV